MQRTRMAWTLIVAAGLCHAVRASEGTDGSFQSSDGIKIHYIEAGRETATGSPVSFSIRAPGLYAVQPRLAHGANVEVGTPGIEDRLEILVLRKAVG